MLTSSLQNWESRIGWAGWVRREFERKAVVMIDLNKFKKILEDNEERFPLLTLDEFFKGNTEEDSIAPNQWEEGRPSLAEIWDML